MAGDGAQGVRGAMGQDVIVISRRRGESCRDSNSALVQCDVKMANVPEDVYGGAVRPAIPRFQDDFVPQVAEVVLESRECILDVELGNRRYNPRRNISRIIVVFKCTKDLAGDVDQVCKQNAITMCNVVLKDTS